MDIYSKRKVSVLLAVIFLAAAATSKAQTTPVQAEEKSIQIPTYLLGTEDPNPPFQAVNSHKIYPYTALDDLTNHREIKTYKAIILENAYLRAIILPALGGRLYSLYDKVTRREVFYRNNTVKYGLVGLRGAWISGGIEFNFPNGHTTDTVSLVSSRYQTNSDGSATAFVGDVDRVSGMYWQVALTLRPGAARLEQHIVLFNPTPVPHLYWYWNNAAVSATEDMRFIYPMREVNPDIPGVFWTYPIWNGTDYSWYKDIRKPTALFGIHVHRNFFGAYYEKADRGVVHFADFREDTGKKLWSWGVSGNGTIWTNLLTDKDGPYNEIQAGRFETQLHQDVMPPQVVESWTEFWYPVDHLNGGFVAATRQFAINVNFLSQTGPRGTIQLSISPTEHISNATIAVSIGSKAAKRIQEQSFDPLVTRTFSIPVEDIQAAKGKAVVEIIGQSGRSILHWNAAEPVDGNPEFVSKVGIHPQQQVSRGENQVGSLFLDGVRAEQSGHPEDAEDRFHQVLKLDPNYVPALLKLAVQHYRAADFMVAEKYVKRALQQNDADPRTLYLAGIIYNSAGNSARAQDELWAATRLTRSPQALAQLGKIALSRKDYSRAENLLRTALSYSPQDALVQSNLSAALRMEGKLTEAAKVANDAVLAMPLYPDALAEQWRVAEARDSHSNDARSAREEWTQAVGNRMQNYLEAGSWYWSIHDWASSDFILHAALQSFAPNEVSPMVYYYLASNAMHQGASARAAEYLAKGRAARYDRVFPNDLSDVAVLQEALLHDPGDTHAQYFLGNFLFQHGRYTAAEKLWLQARAGGFEYSVLDRNLGVDAWKVKNNLAEAASWYEKAIRLAPEGYRYYVDLDEIYAQQGATAARKKLFSSAPSGVIHHDAARIRYILLLMQEKQYDSALALMQGHQFKPWEQGRGLHDMFSFAEIQAGRGAMAAGKFNQAQQDFERALTYPANLGIGKPENPDQSAAQYWLGIALQKQGNKEAARSAWEQLLKQTPATDLSRYYGALALQGLGRKKEAADALINLAEAPVHGKNSAENYYIAGLAERQRGQELQANLDFRKALEIKPSFWQAQLELD